MQVKVGNLDGLKRSLEVNIPWSTFSEKMNEKLAELKKTMKLDGYRVGKVPEHVIKQRFSKSIEHDVLNDVVRETLPNALKDEGLTPANTPEVDSLTIEEGQPVKYTAVFEIIPDLVLKDLKSEKIAVPAVKVSAKDIEEAIESLRKQRTDWKEVTRASQDGDQITIDFEGMVDGQVFQGGQANDFTLILGEGRMIPGFEDGLKNLTAGTKTDLNVTFPADYQAKDLAGKPAVFKITVKKVCAPELPDLNDEFATAWGIEEGGIEALKEEIKIGLEREAGNIAANQTREIVFNKLLELNSFEIPNALIDEEIEQMHHVSAQEMKTRYGVKDAPRAPREVFEATARRSVAMGLLVRQIVKDHNIELDSSKVAEIARNQATAYENPEQMLQYMLSNKNYMSNLQAQALEQQVIDKMLETAIVEHVETSYADLTKKNDTHVHDENCGHEHDDH